MMKAEIEEILKRQDKTKVIPEILGIEEWKYESEMIRLNNELNDILVVGRYVQAAYDILKWLGIDDNEIDLEKLMKSMLMVRRMVIGGMIHNARV